MPTAHSDHQIITEPITNGEFTYYVCNCASLEDPVNTACPTIPGEINVPAIHPGVSASIEIERGLWGQGVQDLVNADAGGQDQWDQFVILYTGNISLSVISEKK